MILKSKNQCLLGICHRKRVHTESEIENVGYDFAKYVRCLYVYIHLSFVIRIFLLKLRCIPYHSNSEFLAILGISHDHECVHN